MRPKWGPLFCCRAAPVSYTHLDNDLKSILERVGNEVVEINGRPITLLELNLMTMQRKAAKGDVPASRHLAKMRADAGVGKQEGDSGVLVVPGTVSIDKWSAAAALQQAKYREKIDDDGRPILSKKKIS